MSDIRGEEYRQQLDILSNASIGQHVRHILEFYDCLFTGCETGSVNYDNRKRDLTLEEDRIAAIARIYSLRKKTGSCNGSAALQLSATLGSETCTTATNLGRELLYNIEHAIHHLAIIKIGIKNSFPHISLPENFGIAHSTVKHRSTLKQCAQ